MGGYFGYYAITGIMTLIGMFVSRRLKSKMKKYSQIRVASGKTGAEIAAAMLAHYGIDDVKITAVRGSLTDHYNPAKKTVNLSEAVYGSNSITAAAVAAHECGHAVQHAQSYAWLKLRSAIVPIVSFASKAQQYLLMFALGAVGMNGNQFILMLTIAVFAITAAFAFITLPVEFDASRRALSWLDNSNELRTQEHEYAKDGLWWAAMTYVASALSSLVILLYLVMKLNSRR